MYEDCGTLTPLQHATLDKYSKFSTEKLFQILLSSQKPYIFENVVRGLLQNKVSPKWILEIKMLQEHPKFLEWFAAAYFLKKVPNAYLTYKLRRYYPVFTKQTELGYARNPYGLCAKLSLMWIASNISYASGTTRSLKRNFYYILRPQLMQPSKPMSHENAKSEIFFAWVKRLEKEGIMKEGIDKKTNSRWTCENALNLYPAALYQTIMQNLHLAIKTIILQMQNPLSKMTSLAILVASYALNHAFAIMIKIKKDYISVLFYDPNAEFGDLKTTLAMDEDWDTKLHRFMAVTQLNKYAPMTDVNLFCLNTTLTQTLKFRLENLTNVILFKNEFIFDILRVGGGYGEYYNKIMTIFQSGGVNVNFISKQGVTFLYIASQLNHIEIVKFLVAQPGIKLNFRNPGDQTALFYAAYKGHAKIVEILVGQKEIDVNLTDNNSTTPLLTATKMGHANIVQILVDKPSINLNLANKKGETPLYVAVFTGREDIVRILIKEPSKIDLNIPNQEGFTPLLVAIYKKNIRIVEILANSPRIDLESSPPRQPTPLLLASSKGYENIVKILQDAIKKQKGSRV